MTDLPAYRLPRTVVPRRYEITLTPDLQSATFAGTERVEVEVTTPVDEVVLNAVELEILGGRLVDRAGREISLRVSTDEHEERATLSLERTADAGIWWLELEFSGILNDKLHGFYRSRFTDDNGDERVIATTQFEATDARRAFPCWDEPDFKARFQVTLVVDPELTAVSNAGVVGDEQVDGRRRVQFAETIVMSTYLVAFVVGPFVATDPVDVDGVPLRVVSVPGKLALADFALEIGAASLRFFAGYFGIPYPADKLDLIAIPDFAFGAMENLGAVTFRETALLVDPVTASRLERERVAQVVAHEIAHMWFGDLVTMRWWNGIWLNEAFATFMELLSVDDYCPAWETWKSFGVDRAAAMTVDGLASTRPVEFPVGRPEEAEGMFDVLTYQKGCAVLRMLEQYLEAEPFRQGISRYLADHAHGNTDTTDLWDAIETASGEPARAIMGSWIFQGGYPLVSVEVDGDGRSIVLTQRRFRYGEDAEGDSVHWQVPVALRASVGGEVVRRRLLAEGARTTVELAGRVEWVVVNEGGWGFYRVRYSSDLLARLTGASPAGLDVLERFNLVSDTWAAVLAGESPLSQFVALISSMGTEDHPDVWTAMLSPVRLLDKVVAHDERPVLAAFVRRLTDSAFRAVGWEPAPDDTERTGELRALLIGARGTVGDDEAVRSRCRQLHDDSLADRNAVAPDLVNAVISVVADSGDATTYERFLERFRHPATPQEEERYLYGLGRFADPELIDRTLDLCLTDEVRTQNAPYLLGQMLAGRRSGRAAWAFLRRHWDTACSRFPDNSIPRMVEGLAGQADDGLTEEATSFFAEHPVTQGELLVRQTLERMTVNATFARRAARDLAQALS